MHVIDVMAMVIKMMDIVFIKETVIHVIEVMAMVMEVMDIVIVSKLLYMC